MGIFSYFCGRYSTLYIFCLYPTALNPAAKARWEESLSILLSLCLFYAQAVCHGVEVSSVQQSKTNGAAEHARDAHQLQRRSDIVSSAVLIGNPIVDFGVQVPLGRVLPATTCRLDTENHSPPVFCARLAGVVPAESISIELSLCSVAGNSQFHGQWGQGGEDEIDTCRCGR